MFLYETDQWIRMIYSGISENYKIENGKSLLITHEYIMV